MRHPGRSPVAARRQLRALPGSACPPSRLLAAANTRVMGATSGLFSHGPYPLADTLGYRGDPGLFGPGSVTWAVVGDTAVFVGGIRALLLQAAHPEVAAGVAEHSRYREDPLGRLSRTAAYVTATSFSATPEVEWALDMVARRHRPVTGRSHRDRPYVAGVARSLRFLRRPPLPLVIRPAYSVFFRAAAATLPPRVRRILGIGAVPCDIALGRASVAALRWSLGSSPDWRLALARTGGSPPLGVGFRQPGSGAALRRKVAPTDAQT